MSEKCKKEHDWPLLELRNAHLILRQYVPMRGRRKRDEKREIAYRLVLAPKKVEVAELVEIDIHLLTNLQMRYCVIDGYRNPRAPIDQTYDRPMLEWSIFDFLLLERRWIDRCRRPVLIVLSQHGMTYTILI